MCGVLLAAEGDGDLNGVHFHIYDLPTQLRFCIGNLSQYRAVLTAATLANSQIVLSGGWKKQQVRKGNTFNGSIQASTRH